MNLNVHLDLDELQLQLVDLNLNVHLDLHGCAVFRELRVYRLVLRAGN